ncbi:MAG: nitronate monooxygenase [Thermodesulfobacteriota bacterium]
MFKTRVTEMLGIEYPIVAGGMAYISRAGYAAAVSNAGGLGIITSANFETAEELREEIKKTKSLTNKPFGININLFPSRRPMPNDEFIETLIDEGVAAVETSGTRSPAEYFSRLKEGGVKCIHKCAAARHARRAENDGADMVTVVGFENGGALGMDDVPTMVLVPVTRETVKIPVLAGGGIVNGRGFIAALALGAEGVTIGTGFMATEECPTHPKFKEWMVRSKETDLAVIERSIGLPHRSLRNKAVEQVEEMEARGAAFEELVAVVAGENYKRAILDGELDAGLAYCGLAVGLIHRTSTVKEFIDGIIAEASAIAQQIASLGGVTK